MEGNLFMAGRKNKYDTNVKPYLDDINKKIRQGVTECNQFAPCFFL